MQILFRLLSSDFLRGWEEKMVSIFRLRCCGKVEASLGPKGLQASRPPGPIFKGERVKGERRVARASGARVSGAGRAGCGQAGQGR